MKRCDPNCIHFKPFNLKESNGIIHKNFMCGQSFFYVKLNTYNIGCEYNIHEIKQYNNKIKNPFRRISRWILRKPKEHPICTENQNLSEVINNLIKNIKIMN